MSQQAIASIREMLTPCELMLTVPVRDQQSFPLAKRLEGFADYLLLDTAHPTTGVVGATGLVHDWDLSARIVAASPVPIILAGGLGPENVVDAIRRVRPSGVDSETCTSRDDDRRRKDPQRSWQGRGVHRSCSSRVGAGFRLARTHGVTP
jgi:phosphoribosylanthranilate isomerase